MAKNTPFYLLMGIILLSGAAFWWRTAQHDTQRQVGDVLRVGLSSDYPPFTYKENDTLVGLDIDLVREVGQRLNKDIEFVDMPFVTLMPQLQTGAIHLIASGLARTEERSACALFTIPYVSGDTFIIVTPRTAPALENIDDLAGKRVAVNEGYTADQYLAKMPTIQTLRLPSMVDAFMALETGRADALVAPMSGLLQIRDQGRLEEYRLFTIPEMCENIALAVSKQYPELCEQLSSVLQDMATDGTLDTLKSKWGVI